MNKVMYFVTLLAWVTMVVSIVYSAITFMALVYYLSKYNVTEFTRDKIRGTSPSYPWVGRLIPAIISAMWLIAYYK
jgi:hypothetical protein